MTAFAALTLFKAFAFFGLPIAWGVWELRKLDRLKKEMAAKKAAAASQAAAATESQAAPERPAEAA